MTSNLTSTITYKCGRVELFRTSFYFVISKLIQLFAYSFHVSCIILLKVYFHIARSVFPFLFNWEQSKANVVNQKWVIFFRSSKIFFCSFQFLLFFALLVLLLFASFQLFLLFSTIQLIIFTTLFQRWSALWNSTLKITTLFRRCLTLLISTLK